MNAFENPIEVVPEFRNWLSLPLWSHLPIIVGDSQTTFNQSLTPLAFEAVEGLTRCRELL